MVGADPADPPTGTRGSPAVGTGEEVVADLRQAYRRHLLVLAARDLAGEIGVDEVGARWPRWPTHAVGRPRGRPGRAAAGTPRRPGWP